MELAMVCPAGSSACRLLLAAALLLLFASSGAAAQQANCSSAKFPPGRSFQRCATLPVLGASLFWTYHPGNGTADVAFRATSSGTNGWVAWGMNTEGSGMVGSSVFIASQGASGAVSVLPTYLASTSPTLTPGNLRFNVSGAPAAEYSASAGAYTIYVTVVLPGNATQQNTVWQAGPLVNGQIGAHPLSAPNLQSTMTLDFLSGGNRTTAGALDSRLSRRNLRAFHQG